jgi:hypothetical protein
LTADWVASAACKRDDVGCVLVRALEYVAEKQPYAGYPPSDIELRYKKGDPVRHGSVSKSNEEYFRPVVIMSSSSESRQFRK